MCETELTLRRLASSLSIVSSVASGIGWMMKPPAPMQAIFSPAWPMRTPRPTLDGVCSETKRYFVRSSAISPSVSGALPVTGLRRPVKRVTVTVPSVPTPPPTSILPLAFCGRST